MEQVYTEADIKKVAKEVLEHCSPNDTHTTVVTLSGDLGAGKTTLVQAIAKELGVQEVVTSPTFVIAKQYTLTHSMWKQLIHIDAYRIDSSAELLPIGWSSMLCLPNTLMIIEWPERVADMLPEQNVAITITHERDMRRILLI